MIPDALLLPLQVTDTTGPNENMERFIDRLIFISVFLAIIFLMHLYSFGRLSSLFGIRRNLWYYVTIALLASSLVLSTILCRVSYNFATRSLYLIAACWFGVQFILFAVVLFYEIPRLALRSGGRPAGIAIISCVTVLSLASMVNAHFIRIKEVEIPAFGKEAKAVLLSDIHIGTIWSGNHLRKIVDRTNSLKPDVVFMTGDLVSGGAVLREESLAPLRDLEAKTFFVHGNHEHYEGIEEIEKALLDVGIRVLNNERTDFEGIEIIGLDYPTGENHMETILKKMDISENKPTVLLSHAPADPKNDKVELVLAGHTHAGQIFPFNFVVRSRYKYIKGLYTLGPTRLYVTPGTGTWGPPMRLGSVNEITLLRLRQ